MLFIAIRYINWPIKVDGSRLVVTDRRLEKIQSHISLQQASRNLRVKPQKIAKMLFSLGFRTCACISSIGICQKLVHIPAYGSALIFERTSGRSRRVHSRSNRLYSRCALRAYYAPIELCRVVESDSAPPLTAVCA